MRDVAYQFFRFEVRDRDSKHFWFDDWLEKGRMIEIIGGVGTTYLGVARHAKIRDAITLEG